ncbi:MAG: GtrA family protein [Ruminococcaceae bacterium]|nr:GtrA family protein [Oscillospiraceae bacterium]
MKQNNLWQAVKFALFSISAGVIQAGSFTVLNEIFKIDDEYGITYFISLALSIIWNFTFNRKYTFKSATNVPIAMAKVFGFYLVFTPLSIWLGVLAVDGGINEYIVLGVTMLSNLILEFLFCKFVVYRGQENTLDKN